jgi:hypothetical protein
MLSDPISITVNAVAQSMPRVSSNGLASTYKKSDGTFRFEVTHAPFTRDKKNRVRSLVKFFKRAIVADPLTSVNDWEELGISMQIDRPEVGFSSTEVDQVWAGLKTFLDTTMIGKLYGQES